jgi:proline iminopeptidase
VTPRALFLHGGPGLNDYLGPLADELDGLFEIERYEQGPHLDVPSFVSEALEHLDEPRWLVGHSWGGRLAFEIAAVAPESVLGIVAIGSIGAIGAANWDTMGARMAARLTAEEVEAAEAATDPLDGLRLAWPAYFPSRDAVLPFPEDVRVVSDALPAVLDWIVAHADDRTTPNALRSFVRPVRAIHGNGDVVSLAAMEETVALMPNAELAVLDGVGHFPWLERPGSVRNAVRRWLAAEHVDIGGARSS